MMVNYIYVHLLYECVMVNRSEDLFFFIASRRCGNLADARKVCRINHAGTQVQITLKSCLFQGEYLCFLHRREKATLHLYRKY